MTLDIFNKSKIENIKINESTPEIKKSKVEKVKKLIQKKKF